ALKAGEARWEVAEQQLEALRAAPPPPPSVSKVTASSSAPPKAPAAAEPEYKGPQRSAKRVAMPENFDVQIDGIPGRMVDVSLTGAQILVPTALKPNRAMKLTIPYGGEAVITCKGKIMWSRLEPSIKGGQLWYRGGVLFTST